MSETGGTRRRPRLELPVGQAWFWSQRWQQAEREADEAVRSGDVARLATVEELLADLDG